MIFDFFDSPELLDIQRTGFYRFLKEEIPQLLAKEFPIKVFNGAYEIELCLNENAIKLIAPEDNPRDCILKMKTYNCKLYAQVKIVCKRSSGFSTEDDASDFLDDPITHGFSICNNEAYDGRTLYGPKGLLQRPLHTCPSPLHVPTPQTPSGLRGERGKEGVWGVGSRSFVTTVAPVAVPPKGGKEGHGHVRGTLNRSNPLGVKTVPEKNSTIVYESLPEWIFLGQLPMMTKRGHFIINGSPRVIVHQAVRSPGIYFQKLIKKDDQNRARFYGDIIPLKGVWVRLQMTKKGRVEAKFKKGKKVEVELLQKCLQVIENQTLHPTPQTPSGLRGEGVKGSRLSLFQKAESSLGSSYKSSRFFRSLRAFGENALFYKKGVTLQKKTDRRYLNDTDLIKLLSTKKSRAESKAEHDAFVHTYDKLYRTTQDKELEEWQKKKKNQKFLKEGGFCGGGASTIFSGSEAVSLCTAKPKKGNVSKLTNSQKATFLGERVDRSEILYVPLPARTCVPLLTHLTVTKLREPTPLTCPTPQTPSGLRGEGATAVTKRSFVRTCPKGAREGHVRKEEVIPSNQYPRITKQSKENGTCKDTYVRVRRGVRSRLPLPVTPNQCCARSNLSCKRFLHIEDLLTRVGCTVLAEKCKNRSTLYRALSIQRQAKIFVKARQVFPPCNPLQQMRYHSIYKERVSDTSLTLFGFLQTLQTCKKRCAYGRSVEQTRRKQIRGLCSKFCRYPSPQTPKGLNPFILSPLLCPEGARVLPRRGTCVAPEGHVCCPGGARVDIRKNRDRSVSGVYTPPLCRVTGEGKRKEVDLRPQKENKTFSRYSFCKNQAEMGVCKSLRTNDSFVERRSENVFKRKKCSENLFATFKSQSRYDLGRLGRERINKLFGYRSCVSQSPKIEHDFYKCITNQGGKVTVLSPSPYVPVPRTYVPFTPNPFGVKPLHPFFASTSPFGATVGGKKGHVWGVGCGARKGNRGNPASPGWDTAKKRIRKGDRGTFFYRKPFDPLNPDHPDTTQLTALDLCAATLWLYRLRKGEVSTDDIDHSQNRRVRTSGELLQTQFENGVYRLRNLVSTKLQEWRGDQVATLSSIFKESYLPRYNSSVMVKSLLKSKPVKRRSLSLFRESYAFSRTKQVFREKGVKATLFRTGVLYGQRSALSKVAGSRVMCPYKSESFTSSNSPSSYLHLPTPQTPSLRTCPTPQTPHPYGVKGLRGEGATEGGNRRGTLRGEGEVTRGGVTKGGESKGVVTEGGVRVSQSFVLRAKQNTGGTPKATNGLQLKPGIVPASKRVTTTKNPALLKERKVSYKAKLCMPTIKELFSTKPITGALREFFGSNPLSQYMDQTNPLAEITHKRRISSLGVGGVSRDSAGMAIRGIHPTHYGRICPIETPEGKNAGLVNSLAFYTKLDRNGFLKTPYLRVFKGQVQSALGFSFCSAKEESETGLQIAPSDLQRSSNNVLRTSSAIQSEAAQGFFTMESVPVRVAKTSLDVFKKENPYNVQAIAISPIQMISVATSLIPFLEHNDANRALMGSNMQRQAVPLMISERPIVGTGLESIVVLESGQTTESQTSGFASHVSADRIVVDRLFNKKRTILSVTTTLRAVQGFTYCSSYKSSYFCKAKNNCTCTAKLSRKLLSFTRNPFGVKPQTPLGLNPFTPCFALRKSCFVPPYILRGIVSKPCALKNGLKRRSYKVPALGQRNACNRYSFLASTISRLTTFSRSNQNTCIAEKPLLREFDWVQKGDPLTDCSASNNGELSVGKNVLLAYIPWEGYNFEDAIVISERLVREHVYTSLHIERYVFQAQDLKEGAEWFTKHLPGVKPSSVHHLEESGLPKIGSFLKEGDIIVGKIRYLAKKPSSPYERLLCDILGEKNFAARNKSLYVPKGVRARVIYHKAISFFEDERENKVRPPQAAKTVHVFLGEKRVIQVGDKISGRHGNKGVISTILPTQDMPYLPDGTPIDLILNPLGVPSRMNVGQVLECLLGLAASYLSTHFKIAAFDEKYGVEASKSIVFLKLYQARLMSGQAWLFQVAFPGKTRLVDGRSGECFDQWITVGKAYILKLIHMVSEKIHARSTGPYALITQQPLRGRSNKGGQRLGEMEVWALEGFGAAYTLQELLTKKSDDFFGRKQIVDSILPNPAPLSHRLHPSYRLENSKTVLGQPEIFKVLLCELQALCLDLGVYILTPESFKRTFLGVVH